MSKRNNMKPSRPRRPRLPAPVAAPLQPTSPDVRRSLDDQYRSLDDQYRALLADAEKLARAAAKPEAVEPEAPSGRPVARVFTARQKWWDSGRDGALCNDMDQPVAKCELFDALAMIDHFAPVAWDRDVIALPSWVRSISVRKNALEGADSTVMIDAKEIPDGDSDHAVLRYHRARPGEIGEWLLDTRHPGPPGLEPVRLARGTS